MAGVGPVCRVWLGELGGGQDKDEQAVQGYYNISRLAARESVVCGEQAQGTRHTAHGGPTSSSRFPRSACPHVLATVCSELFFGSQSAAALRMLCLARI